MVNPRTKDRAQGPEALAEALGVLWTEVQTFPLTHAWLAAEAFVNLVHCSAHYREHPFRFAAARHCVAASSLAAIAGADSRLRIWKSSGTNG